MLNMELLYHLCFLLLVAWDPLQLLFTDVWPPFCLINYISPTTRQFAGHLSFSLLRSVIMCLIMCLRSSCGRPQPAASDISLAVSEAKI